MAIGLESQRTERIIAGNRIFVSSSATLQEGSVTKNFEERGSGYNFKGSGLCSCLICIITMFYLIITRACRLIWAEPHNSLCFIFFLVCAIFYFMVLWCAVSPKNPIVASYTILSQEASQHLHPIMKP